MKTELKDLTTANKGRLFDDVCREFPDHVLEAHSNVLYCDREIMGYGIPLSTATILKSQAFPGVREIVFDEFIIDNTRTYHYLPDEVRKFQDAYETIARPGNESSVSAPPGISSCRMSQTTIWYKGRRAPDLVR